MNGNATPEAVNNFKDVMHDSVCVCVCVCVCVREREREGERDSQFMQPKANNKFMEKRRMSTSYLQIK